MDPSSAYLDLLCDPRVRDMFLRLMESPLSAEEKYQRFLDYCISQQLYPPEPVRPLEPAWDLEDLLARVEDSIRRVLKRMKVSQHRDGGWGPQVERSNFWHTGYAVLFLEAARALPWPETAPGIEEMLYQGVAYLEQHPNYWATDTLSQVNGMSVYEISLMVRCFYRSGRAFLRRESAQRIYRSIDRLYHSQNEDGGWDANVWGYEVTSPVRIWSEVGATSMALQALAATGDDRFKATIDRGALWLAATQNPDGSWNNGSCQPGLPAFQLSGSPAISKTCDALQGILAAGAAGISPQPYRACIARALDWLRRQDRISGWGWGYSAADYENTCLTLETLVRLPAAPPDLLASHATWLVQTQRRQEDDLEDGSWVKGHTARIALSLVSFYRRVQGGGAFSSAAWASQAV